VSLERLKASLPGRVVQKFLADNGPVWSVSVAWGGLFAMFPIILGLAALVGLALGFTGVVTQDQLFSGVLSKVPDPKIRSDLAAALDGVRRNSGILGLVGLVGLYFSATSLFGAMEQAFAAVYGYKPRSFLRSRLMGVTMMVIFAIFGSATVLTSSVLPHLNDLPLAAKYTGGLAPVVAQVIFGAAAGVILFGLIYYVVPPLKLRWAEVWPGALVGGVAFELVGLIFPIYLTLNPAVGVYGQFFALFFILLTYFYLLGLITVIGVEVNAVTRPRGGTAGRRADLRGA
jgi:membrane protein